MGRKQIIAIAVILILAAGGIYAWKEFNRTNADLSTVKSSFEVTADNLIKDFEVNDTASSAKYLGKVITVKGLIKKIDKDDEGYYTVVLGDTSSMSSVRCAMDSAHSKDATSLTPASSVAIKGFFTGYEKDDTGLLGSDVKLNRCVVVKD